MILCKNYDDEAPGCLGMADDRYTMDFSDVEPGAKIYWCSACGPVAHAMDAAIQEAFETRPGFAEEFEEAIETVERGDA
jgi:hypothetical protein